MKKIVATIFIGIFLWSCGDGRDLASSERPGQPKSQFAVSPNALKAANELKRLKGTEIFLNVSADLEDKILFLRGEGRVTTGPTHLN